MQDFTLTTYKKLLHGLLINDYSFQTLENFIQHLNKEKIVILRHDVDRKPGNALKMARLEDEMGIKATYFFRIIKESYDENIIKQIEEMGHEIGYHYENLSEISKEDRKWERGSRIEKRGKSKEELFELAICNFEKNLEKFRKFYPVKTICMHGSPRSKWDNRDLWI